MVVSRGIYPWIICFWNPMLLIRAKFANGHINYQLSHFQNYFPFFFQFLSLFYLMVPKMHLRAHIFQNFLEEHALRPPSLGSVHVAKSYWLSTRTCIYLFIELNPRSQICSCLIMLRSIPVGFDRAGFWWLQGFIMSCFIVDKVKQSVR